MRCLVLGGDGFIGSYISERLLYEGHEVIIYTKPNTFLCNLKSVGQRIKYVFGDFREEPDFSSILQNIDWVFHMVCTTLPANENAITDIEENVKPTLKLLEACRKTQVRKIIFISSGGTVYGPSMSRDISEMHPTEPICAYGIQKLMIEKYLRLYYFLYGIDYGIMRVSNPYGDRQNPSKPQGVIGAFIAKALQGQTVEFWGDGSVVRDFLYVLDVAKAAMMLASYNGPEKIFNIGSGRGYSLNEILDTIEKVINKKVSRVYKTGRKQDVSYNVLDISNARSVLGWNPEIDLLTGIEKVVYAWEPKFKQN